MKRENLHEPFTLVYEKLSQTTRRPHQNSFFELVFILSGSGVQCINKNSFHYHSGHMFLITPDDCHSFEVSTETEFFFLRFNDIYIKNGGIAAENIQRLEYILQHANHKPGCILKNQTDKTLVRPIIEAIIREQVNLQVYNQELIQQLVNTLIVVVARNIAMYLTFITNRDIEDKAHDLLQYIQSNIYYPEKLRAEYISNKFNISEAYLGRYFKKHTAETMQQYIMSYKTRLIEHRLQFSDKRLNEIANEFGFSDESHFNKFFRKQKGESPKNFRKSVRLPLPA